MVAHDGRSRYVHIHERSQRGTVGGLLAARLGGGVADTGAGGVVDNEHSGGHPRAPTRLSAPTHARRQPCVLASWGCLLCVSCTIVLTEHFWSGRIRAGRLAEECSPCLPECPRRHWHARRHTLTYSTSKRHITQASKKINEYAIRIPLPFLCSVGHLGTVTNQWGTGGCGAHTHSRGPYDPSTHGVLALPYGHPS